MKKNHLALIFLTVITMVGVWYLKSPINNANTTPTEDVPAAAVSSRLEAIEEMRAALREERNITVASLDQIIASADTSLVEKASAISEKQVISDLTEKEVLLELQIINSGFQDAFVHSTTSGVEVLVVAEENSSSTALDIINMVYLSFEDAENVVVNFKKVEELTSNN